MTAELKTSLVSSVQTAAKQAGLVMVSATEGTDSVSYTHLGAVVLRSK